MATQGHSSNAAKWGSKGVGIKKREASVSGSRYWVDPLKKSGLPSPAKFSSGYLPRGAIPVTQSVLDDGDDSESGSDMDESMESEEEVYGGRYSLDSSPQDDMVQRRQNAANGPAQRYGGAPLSRNPNYGSDSVCSDFSSSRETIGLNKVDLVEKMGGGRGGANRYPVGEQDYSEDELSDSAMSSEDDSTRIGSSNGGATYTSEGCSSSVHSQTNVEKSAHKEFRVSVSPRKNPSEDDVPSAPPLYGPGQAANHSAENNSTSTPHVTLRNAMSNGSPIIKQTNTSAEITSAAISEKNSGNTVPCQSVGRNKVGVAASTLSSPLPARIPTFHASGQGPWFAVISYDACVRLCLHLWAKGCVEATIFLENECELLQNSFGLQQVLLQPEEELLARRSSNLISEVAASKPKKIIGKMKVQVRKVKMAMDPPTGCGFSTLKAPIKMKSLQRSVSSLNSNLTSGCLALCKVCVAPRLPANGSLSRHSLAYVHASTQYIKEVSGLLKGGVTTLRNSSSTDEVAQETYSCVLKLKSSTEEDAVRMQPGSGETHVFFPDSLGDDLIIEVQNSKGKYYGRVLAQLATIAEDQGDKLRWWSIYSEPEHEFVGKVQLYINYSTSADENGHNKCGSVAETVAYDLVLEVAMKVQHFQQRKLLLHDPWKWLLMEFASYYGVSDAYTKLRYLSYVMDVATPTADCLDLVHDYLLPVIMKGKTTLSHQEKRILGEVEDQIEHILALVFENYKSLDESLPSGMMDAVRPATGSPAHALAPAIKLYTLLHDVLTPEVQLKLCSYFQAAGKKRSRWHLAETDEYVTNNNEGTLMDATVSTAYQKMKSLCLNIRNEVLTDREIHNHNVLPSFIDLPNISSSIYSVELCTRLRAFLVACPPTGPSPAVVELLIAAADFQRDLASWNITPEKGGVDAKELFHLYILLWIGDKRLSLLESCKLDKVKWSGVRTQHSTTPFVDDMYNILNETLHEYETIIFRWPEYTFVLENAIADVEKAIFEALEKQYADVISPLKDNLAPKKFGLKYIQKLASRSVSTYVVPEELGILLNSMRRMLDVLRPRIETQLKSWGSCIPSGGGAAPGERLNEITVMMRAKFRNYLQAVVEKLAENTRIQSATKIKKIIQDSKRNVVESDVRSRMQPLKNQLENTIDHLHTVCETPVFIAICRGYWDRMGQDVLSFLENRKENRVWYKGSRITVSILDDTFASQMQQLLGNGLQEKDLEPPRSIMEVRSILCKDAPNHKDSNYYG